MRRLCRRPIWQCLRPAEQCWRYRLDQSHRQHHPGLGCGRLKAPPSLAR
jgi:hypothetical protein